MTPLSRKPLTNTFSFASQCFVCDQDNADGMRQRFYHDEESGRIVAEFTPSPGHSGAPNYTHGGASMAVLDDAMAWAIIALRERFGITRRCEMDFIRPVTIGARHAVEAWVESFEERSLVARAEMRNADGKLCVASKATYIVLTMEEAMNAIGAGAATAASYTEPAS
jgi:uncharacterized protein (TIGR00369 family)